MNDLFITPIKAQTLSGDFFNIEREADQSTKRSMFRDAFDMAIRNVVESENDLNDKQYLLATGQIDDAHTVPIATAKAQLSVEFLVALRTKALESYNELIRLSV